MPKVDQPATESYTELEAARELGVSLARLRSVLDEHIFNDGSRRPNDLRLLASDLVLLRFWLKGAANPKVLRMPRR